MSSNYFTVKNRPKAFEMELFIPFQTVFNPFFTVKLFNPVVDGKPFEISQKLS